MKPVEHVGSITVGHHARISEVYGAYSSHEVHISVTVPATREELENMEELAEHYQDRCIGFGRNVFNRVLESVGKAPLFGIPETLEAAEDTDGDA